VDPQLLNRPLENQSRRRTCRRIKRVRSARSGSACRCRSTPASICSSSSPSGRRAHEPQRDRRHLHPRRTRQRGRARPRAPHIPQITGRLDRHQRCEARGCARAAARPSGTAPPALAPPPAAHL